MSKVSSVGDDILKAFNHALSTAQPSRVVAVLHDIGDDAEVRYLIERSGSNLGLWDFLQVLDAAGLRLQAVRKDE